MGPLTVIMLESIGNDIAVLTISFLEFDTSTYYLFLIIYCQLNKIKMWCNFNALDSKAFNSDVWTLFHNLSAKHRVIQENY